MGKVFFKVSAGAVSLALVPVLLASISSAEMQLRSPRGHSPEMRAPRSDSPVPSYVLKVPEGHFAGISGPCRDPGEARISSMNDVLRQILRAMGATASLVFEEDLRAEGDRVRRSVRDNLQIQASWFVSEMEQRTVRSDYVLDKKGMWTCFTLVHFPSSKLDELRRLTIGPKLTARMVKRDSESVLIRVIESAGAGATLTGYGIDLMTKNRHAEIITLFAWKVTETSRKTHEGTLRNPVYVKGTSETLHIPKPAYSENAFKGLLLGTEIQLRIALCGYDELGRPISVPVTDF